MEENRPVVFFLIIAAVVLRKGLFPLLSGITDGLHPTPELHATPHENTGD